jgi:mono/diheme cytochrome c family protein
LRKIILGILTMVLIGSIGTVAWTFMRSMSPRIRTLQKGRGECCEANDTTSPFDLIKATPNKQLKNPYNADIAAVAKAGHHLYHAAGCSGCHGGGGGGGMCPPLTNYVWIYGPGDDTLFRLIALGTDTLHEAGYNRVKHEVVSAPMPPFRDIIKTSDDLWKIIAFIRSVNPDSLKNADQSHVAISHAPQ